MAMPTAWALGFGAGPVSAELGRPLDQTILLRLDADEVLTAECVTADVMLGDRRVPPADVATRLEPRDGRLTLRVLSSAVVDEPVVSLSIGLGCPQRLSRKFIVFADPPDRQLPSAPLTAPVAAAEPASASPSRRANPTPAPVPAPAARPPAPAPGAVATAAPPPSTAPARRARAVARRSAEVPPAARPSAAAGRPRLRLDAADAEDSRLARAAAAEMAASAAAAMSEAQAAARVMAAAASAAEDRVAELERVITRMRAEAQADREAMRALRQRAEQPPSHPWMPYLLMLLAALLLLLVWMALKLRRLQHEQHLAWLGAAAEAERAATAAAVEEAVPTVATGAGPVTTRPAALSPVFPPEPAPALSEPDTEPPTSPPERTQALPVGWRDEAEGPRDVSVEELIDLEQQAEFFCVLGQEDAAIDLLVDYLRSTGGGSPMPYLKLLEIYRRRGDREAYDRTRARFNHRFNAYAPDWDDDPAQGRSLEDYPAIVTRLQAAWSSPIDAMAELESLLFRKSRGELFDLPAYRDVMFLYSLARDLLDREPLETGNVDVLLPISDGSDFTQPMSFEDTPLSADSAMLPLDNPPTLPVDLDVTLPAMPESLFGETATLPGAQTRRRI